MTPKEQKTNKLDFIKIKKKKKHFYASKDTIKKVKDKNRRIYLQIKYLIKVSRIHKELNNFKCSE